jgi:DNA-binding PadR family transcriptional regulator
VYYSNPNYQKHAILFFNTIVVDYTKDDTYLYSEAEKYIKNESDFRHKDSLETGTLLSVLKDKGFVKFLGYTLRHTGRYSITDNGVEYLNSLKK